SGCQLDLAVADRVSEVELDLVLRVREVAAVIFRPQILHRSGASAKLQRDQMVFPVVVQALVAVPVPDNLLALQLLGVALRRPHRPRPSALADGLADVPLRQLRVCCPGGARKGCRGVAGRYPERAGSGPRHEDLSRLGPRPGRRHRDVAEPTASCAVAVPSGLTLSSAGASDPNPRVERRNAATGPRDSGILL